MQPSGVEDHRRTASVSPCLAGSPSDDQIHTGGEIRCVCDWSHKGQPAKESMLFLKGAFAYPCLKASFQPVPHSLEGDNVGVLQLPKVFDVRLLEVSHLLDSNLLPMEASQEDRSLGSTAHPL